MTSNWSELYEVGDPQTDKEHKLLFELDERLAKEVSERSVHTPSNIIATLTEFANHALSHFNNEEKYMATLDMPKHILADHIKEHNAWRKHILQVTAEISKEFGEADRTDEVIDSVARKISVLHASFWKTHFQVYDIQMKLYTKVSSHSETEKL